VSKLARVTEELESLIHPTASTVHEEEEEEKEKEVLVSVQPETPTIMKVVEPEESIILPEVSTPIEKLEEVSAYIEQERPTIAKIAEPEESIVLPQIQAPITTAVEEQKKMDTVATEVSY
jgi:hypothetical protein